MEMAQVDERHGKDPHGLLYLPYTGHQTTSGVSFAPVTLLYFSLKHPQRDVRGHPHSQDTLGEAHRWHSETSTVSVRGMD